MIDLGKHKRSGVAVPAPRPAPRPVPAEPVRPEKVGADRAREVPGVVG